MSSFYYYPEVGGTLETVALGEQVGDLQGPWLQRDGPVVQAVSGGVFDGAFRRWQRWRVRHEGINSLSVVRKLEAMIDHLRRGGVVAFAVTETKAYAAFTRPTHEHQRGNTAIYTENVQPFRYAGAITLASGDEVVLASASPDSRSEIRVLSSGASSYSLPVDALIHTYPTGQAHLVRQVGYLPAVRLPPELYAAETLWGSDFGVHWTLDLVLDEAVDAIADAAAVLATPNTGATPSWGQPSWPTQSGTAGTVPWPGGGPSSPAPATELSPVRF